MTTHPTATSSYAQFGLLRGRIESIDDPEKRNRVQIRVFGYQDDKANIPNEKLEWIHVLSQSAQIPGAASSHKYYPGSDVYIMDSGNERHVLGALPGFDGEKRLNNQNSEVDTSENKKPDLSVKQRGDGDKKDVFLARSSPGLVEGVQGLKKYFNYGQFSSMIKKFDSYARGKGEPPAPYGKGTQAKLDQLKSIGLDKLVQGSDLLSVINKLDGNLSGAFKAAIQIIKNLRNNGFDIVKNIIDAGALSQADSQYNNTFGLSINTELISLLEALLNFKKLLDNLEAKDLYSFASSGEIDTVIGILQNQHLQINTESLTSIKIIIISSNGNHSIDFYIDLLNSLKNVFNEILLLGQSQIISLINDIGNLGGDANGVVVLFGGPQTFTDIAKTIFSVGTVIGIPKDSINNMLFGAVGLALTNNLPIQFNNMINSPKNNDLNRIIGLLNTFMGNNNAINEIMSGLKNMEPLSKIKLKYEGSYNPEHPRNNKPVKKFSD